MAINFTDSPSIGNTVTSGNVTWTWNGQTWESVVSNSVNADTVDGYHAASFALLSGATFTGNVTTPNVIVSSYSRLGTVTSGTWNGRAISTTYISGLATSATTDTTNATNISSGTLAAARLATSGVTAATYGNATNIPTIVVDSYGRITTASNTTFSAVSTGKSIAMAIVFGG